MIESYHIVGLKPKVGFSKYSSLVVDLRQPLELCQNMWPLALGMWDFVYTVWSLKPPQVERTCPLSYPHWVPIQQICWSNNVVHPWATNTWNFTFSILQCRIFWVFLFTWSKFLSGANTNSTRDKTSGLCYLCCCSLDMDSTFCICLIIPSISCMFSKSSCPPAIEFNDAFPFHSCSPHWALSISILRLPATGPFQVSLPSNCTKYLILTRKQKSENIFFGGTNNRFE